MGDSSNNGQKYNIIETEQATIVQYQCQYKIKTIMIFSPQTETALMYDAVQLFATALNELDQSQVNRMTIL